MPEDQGIDGDMWTDEAARLCLKAGWEKITSSNLDIEDTAGKKRGIDAIFHYKDGFSNSPLEQGVFLEAKRYASTSVTADKVSGWITGLGDKISALRRSPGLLEKYPRTKELNLFTGVVALWVHDIENYGRFEEKLTSQLQGFRVPHGNREGSINIRVFFLENRKILRLASLLNTVSSITVSTSVGEEKGFKFYYPSSAFRGNPVAELGVINLEYIYSNIVFGKAYRRVAASSLYEVTDVVFYFGEVNYRSMERLARAIQNHQMVNVQSPLWIYKYARETTEYRKISDDVLKLFRGLGSKEIEVRNMERSDELPTWIVDGDRPL